MACVKKMLFFFLCFSLFLMAPIITTARNILAVKNETLTSLSGILIAMSTKDLEKEEEPAEIPVTEEKPISKEPDEVERIIDQYLQWLTLEQKIGQRFISNIQGKKLSYDIVRLIQNEYIGGVILYPWNIEDRKQVKELTTAIQQKAIENAPPLHLFICVDQEGGRVRAFKLKEVTRFPAPYYWGQYNDPAYIESAAYIVCREIAELGCNMNFAPVLDVYGKPDNSIIGDRSMGKNPEAIGIYGINYIRGAEKAGIISVVKHFPGHGSTVIDSHLDLPIVDMTEAELIEQDAKPFKMVIENGAEAVMTSHVLYRLVDPEYPATLSVYILRKILREKFDFQGVIVSDGLSMGALSKNYEIAETLRLLFKAGIDLILVHSQYDVSNLKRTILDLYETGEITEDEINEGVRRILRLKLKYRLLPLEIEQESIY